MKIPKIIEISIIDEFGNPNTIENIIFTFKIYEDEESYFTSSFFKTNNHGIAKITQQDLIKSSELKWENDIENFEPFKTEIMILDSDSTINLKKATENYINTTTNISNLENSLLNSGFTEKNIAAAKEVILRKASEQLLLKELFQTAKNDVFQIITEKIEDKWINDSNKIYEFIIVEKKNGC